MLSSGSLGLKNNFSCKKAAFSGQKSIFRARKRLSRAKNQFFVKESGFPAHFIKFY
ncbi:hypothetical protein HMPREF0663_11948 [Hoylesella oralis ATCC 33269]|uniref:Uncharacterized protein n=1 Tax=Hoylesella oralis ATCC 33269 TaxID=873533 RepID=E7RT75_9BACT|nr:hypothetical protein HMPREF0663_11948 [Hoylesella oralis ATCC 33269]